jgi:hypothetical protein
MDEQEWLSCDDPDRMMACLEGAASDRKLRLLCCACCRRVWHLLETDALRRAVDAFERFADGEMDEESFEAAASVTHPLKNYLDEIVSGQPRVEIMGAAYAVHCATFPFPGAWSRKALELFASAAGARRDEERIAQGNLIREVVGNPFRPAAISPALRCWGDGIILGLATTIYDERSLPAGTLDPERLAILADALEEAGCTDADILNHLRGPGPHYRGCWPVDLLLNKS